MSTTDPRTLLERIERLEAQAEDPARPKDDRWLYQEGADALRSIHRLPRYPAVSALMVPGDGETGREMAAKAREGMERAGAPLKHLEAFEAQVDAAHTWGELRNVLARWVTLRRMGEQPAGPAPSPLRIVR